MIIHIFWSFINMPRIWYSKISIKWFFTKIAATVLDFNQEEREKTGLDGQPSGWLSSFFGQPSAAQRPHHRRTNSTEIHEATGIDMSLAQAFVAFLQTESTPKTPMRLPLKGINWVYTIREFPQSIEILSEICALLN